MARAEGDMRRTAETRLVALLREQVSQQIREERLCDARRGLEEEQQLLDAARVRAEKAEKDIEDLKRRKEVRNAHLLPPSQRIAPEHPMHAISEAAACLPDSAMQKDENTHIPLPDHRIEPEHYMHVISEPAVGQPAPASPLSGVP